MRKSFPLLTLAIGATLFVLGVIYLFLLRFEAGDVYPPYSSLRADPLGTMAWFESLQRLPGLTVRRDVSSTGKLPEDKDTTYLHLAAEEDDWLWLPADLLNDIEAFATRGGRLVVTMYPVTGRSLFTPPPAWPITLTNAPATNAPSARSGKKSSKKKSKTSPEDMPNRISLRKRWGVEFARIPLKQSAADTYVAETAENQTDLPLPEALAWHSALVLTNLDAAWQTIYTRSNRPVMVERQFGRGSVVIATDSYFVSNEAMWKDRQPELLAWFVGPSRQVVFDEAHFGIVEQTGIAVLMRRYRLTGLVGGLVVLALLFIWKNSTSLVPPPPTADAEGCVTGRGATAGYVNLLRRNIPPREILNVIFDEWTKALLHRRNVRIASVDQAQNLMERERTRPATARQPIQTYREISQALRQPVTHHASRITPQEPSASPPNPTAPIA